MATAGKLGAVYAPETDVDDNPIIQENVVQTFDTHTDPTTEFQLDNEYVLRDSETVEVYNTAATAYEETDDYEINYITGLVTLDTATDEDVKVTYDHLDGIEQVAGFFEWNFNEDAGLQESPEFGDDVVTHTQTLKNWSGSANMYFGVDDRFTDWVGEEVVLAFYIDDTAGEKVRFEGWGIIGNKSTTTPVDTLVEESIDIEGQTKLEYRTA